MRKRYDLEPDWMKHGAAVFASKGRVKILRLLRDQQGAPLYFGEIMDATAIPLGSLAKDLRVLRDTGLIRTVDEPSGRAARYVLEADALDAFLTAVDRDLRSAI